MTLRKALMVLAALPGLAAAQTSSILTQQMGIQQKLGQTIPADVPFLDEAGHTVTLADFMGKRPMLLLPIFYKCETGCALITHELLQTLLKTNNPTGLKRFMQRSQDQHPMQVGKDLEVVMLGIDPRETPELANNKKAVIMGALGDPDAWAHWHLLTGKLANIRKVTDAIGFKYYFNATTDVLRHPTGSVIVGPNGKISAYTIGNDFPSKVLESDLGAASRNEVTEPADQSRMFGCIMLDPQTGKIRFVIENIVRLLSFLMMIGVCLAIFIALRNERKASTKSGGRLSGA